MALSTIAPRVYISMNDLPATGLMQTASLARYRAYFKFGPGVDVPRLVERIRPESGDNSISATTPWRSANASWGARWRISIIS